MVKKSAVLKKKPLPKKSIKETGALENYRRMAIVMQDSNDAITFQDLEGNILAWNRGAEIMYGYTQEEALSMNIMDTVPLDYQKEARGFLASLKRGELLPNLETKRKHKDGRIIDVWLTNTKLTDDKGNLTGIATTERDITEKKQSEASLLDKLRELDYLRSGQIALSEKMRGDQTISGLGQSILSHLVPFTNSQSGAFYIVNDSHQLERVSGYALSKPQMKSNIIEFGEGLVGQVAVEKRSLIIEDVPIKYFHKIESDLGAMIPRSLLIVPIIYENEVRGVIELASLYKFTEHQRAFIGHVSENIGIAINTASERKRVQVFLEEAQALNDELEAQSMALKESSAKLESQALILGKQKETLNEKNEALRKAQVLLEEKATEVQRASQYKTEFLANMSHELRTPLNSSLILAKLLMNNSKGNLNDEQIQFASSIYSSGNDLLNLINDILDLSKVEAGKLDINVESVFIPKIVFGIKQTFENLAKEKNLQFSVEVEEKLPELIQTDHQRLDQILKNLISNAIKFTSKGSVQIKVFRHSEGHVGFRVTDSGIGIPKDQQAVIFDAFKQADGATNRNFGGTGLGLSISRDLARLLGGSIEVESAPTTGSHFTLILPEFYAGGLHVPEKLAKALPKVVLPRLQNSNHLEPLPYTDDRKILDSSIRRLLVIEDEPSFSKIIFDLAREMHFQCIVAQSADEGLQMVMDHSPDAILLDIKLPDHLGLTVLDRLKSNTKTRHIPVFAMSADDYKEAALRMGAIGFTSKPMEREMIGQMISKLEQKFTQKVNQVLIVEDDELLRTSMSKLISAEGIEITSVANAKDAIKELKNKVFDCMVLDLRLPDMSGADLLESMSKQKLPTFPPVIIYTGSSLNYDEEMNLRRFSRSIIVKGVHSPERLLDEVSIFLHLAEVDMSVEHRKLIEKSHNQVQDLDNKKILLVDDDIRNIFALTSALEHKGASIIVARNGIEALEKLDLDANLDLVLMDVMMPEMDGYEATRRIRQQKKFANLPIIAVTAKAMKEDYEKCIESGMNDYISKPVELDKLFSLIRVWMPKMISPKNVND